ncbi:hypothetical protein [Streptomyces sp. NPDC048357]|uniref:hypothetical protein n=1 Tax=Streptomyces sp. NPDC048357 TaxID=3154719 RepID=UPI003440E639
MALRPYALLPRQYDDRKVLASTVDAWGRTLWLICRDAVFPSHSHGRARPEPLGLPFDALVVVNDAGAVQERELRGVTVNPYRIDALPNGRIVLEGRSSVGDRNAQIFGRDGRSRRCFAMGAHVAFMMADRRNNLWTAYTDEGIYSDPISSAGLARWDSGGNHLWGYWPPHGIEHITDIEAVNVTDGAAWAVYWPASPLLEARSDGQVRAWAQPVASPRGLAVHDDRVLLLGGHHRGSARQDGFTTAHYGHMADGEAVIAEEAVLTMPNGDPLQGRARPVGRGRNLYLHGRTSKQWYVLGL